ncbi:Ubiquitin carboxyl-terminal hydrolase MINDY-1 like protein [Argiope bruennichi]|uniref:Ubiquitin carboxyl-terminal hydrolase n=2 Tax=Argiope bruennichi TaxID=94029 RepID=A0A8T0FHL6_ARGBR|nr:Ubiquitin carboxyl-terminal hydrolase MINDY-1 like protein [Argiope bruennichi]
MSLGENVELPSTVNENADSLPNLTEPLILPSTSGDNIESSSIESPVKAKSSVIDDKNDSIYQIKWISRNGCKSPIITQNENGPCPLIAITNVLIMKGRITVPSLADFITTENLMAYLGDCILESIPKNIPEGTQLNFEQNMHDAMAVLPKLQTGLDVNVKFTGISDFEYTPECIIFDLLRIPLYHGWLIDPQMVDVMAAVGKCSYNQLVEKIINSKCSSDPERVTEALIAENFLEKTASQLTYHGLCELTSKLKEDELCVLFRNNHFSSLTKHKNCLYQLVTDQGFVNENAVWESLNNIEGDGQFVDADFIPVPPKASDLTLPSELSKEKQIDQDFLVALSLQEEQQKQQNSELEWEDYKKKKLGISNGLTDEELARRLQDEELKREQNHLQEQQQQQQQQQQLQQQGQPSQPSSPNSRNRSRDCIIL